MPFDPCNTCSHLNRDTQMTGSAPTEQAYVVVEVAKPWPRKIKKAADLPEEPGRPAGPSAHRPAPPGQSPLSEREREVAELLLLGMPYRDIGAQLFISAKTVEHHVARIRRRLGAESRSEMLSMLRAILAPVGVTQS